MPSNPAQNLVDSLITQASEELNIDKATLARISAELLTIGLDFARRGEELTQRDADFAQESVDTAIATSGVRKLGKTDRAQDAVFRIGMAMLVGSQVPGVDLAALSR